jgi:hypothetical protein
MQLELASPAYVRYTAKDSAPLTLSGQAESHPRPEQTQQKGAGKGRVLLDALS